LTAYHWWVLVVAILGWLFDAMDQRIFVLARTPALRALLPSATSEELTRSATYATAIFIAGWATGGLVFGLFGDRWGRVRTMMLTILIYSVFTGLSALAQTWYDFAVFRFLCGMGIGGEYAAGVALVAEVMPPRARAYGLGLVQAFSSVGAISGSAVSLVIGPQADFGSMPGWRLLFLVGVLPALLVVVIRLQVRESETWLRACQQAKAEVALVPENGQLPDEFHKQLGDLREIFGDRRLRYHTIIGMTLGLAGQLGMWGIAQFSPELIRSAVQDEHRTTLKAEAGARGADVAHLNALSLDELAEATTGDKAGAAALARQWKESSDRYAGRGTLLQDCGCFIGGSACTLAAICFGRRGAFLLAYLVALGATWLTFGFLSHGSDAYWMMPLLGFGTASVFGAFVVYFPELYPTRLRSTGTGLCYNVARYLTAVGTLTLGQLVVLYSQLGYAAPLRPAAMTMALIYLVGLAVLPLAPETKGKPLPE
jgi:MFS family permease